MNARARMTVFPHRFPRTSGAAATRRVTVTSPQTRLAMEWRPDAPHLTPAEQERARAVYRVQLRRALLAVALLAVLIVGLPVALAVLPGLDDVRLLGIPVSWLAVAVLPYAALVTLAAWHLRRAERAERPGPGGASGPLEQPGRPNGSLPQRGGPRS